MSDSETTSNWEEDLKHDWECTNPGEYDSTYKCKKCGKELTESVDNLDSELPFYGCR